VIPIKINRTNILYWIIFGLKDLGRMLLALIQFKPRRLSRVLRYVEKNAEKGNPESVLKALDEFALRKNFLMNVGKEKGDIVKKSVQSSDARSVLELGAYCGYSAIIIAQELKERQGKLISIEKSKHNAAIAEAVVEYAGLGDYVEFKVGSASEQIRTLNTTFDLVFIDHWKDLYLPDLKLIESKGLLNERAQVVADNVGIFENSLKTYLEYVRTSGRYETLFISAPMEYEDRIEDGVEISTWLGQAA